MFKKGPIAHYLQQCSSVLKDTHYPLPLAVRRSTKEHILCTSPLECSAVLKETYYPSPCNVAVF